MKHKKVSRNFKPAAFWAPRQSGIKYFIVVAPLLQNDAEIFIKDVGLEPIVKKRRRTKAGLLKRANWGFLTSFEPLLTSLRSFRTGLSSGESY